MLKLIKASTIGPGHISDKLPNQDAVGHFINDNYWAIAVCDGMGSRIHADIGSTTAIQSIRSVLKKANFDTSAKTVIAEFYQHWLNTLKRRGVKPNDAVTTVLIAWGNKAGRFRFFQLGDGVICTTKTNHTKTTIDEFSNVTTGLGLSKKYEDWTVGYGALSAQDNVILLMTDGISEDITEQCEFAEALAAFSSDKSPRRVKKHLKNMFVSWPTPFHTDDKSLAMVIIDDNK